ncbi:MAG: LysM peptidoglycan-binding domain-containing protein [Proteobacteria bacterium]|nr:LysM peptidoglycan-binding domain-containing protein [Pseudomonadota bacterium]MDA1352644.1 LysM peptidoglycan-binding domain-containing protein [Pseudomonadota bacterium]
MTNLTLLLSLLLIIAGCSSSPASVIDRAQPPSIRIKTHQVEVGETLYSIAWRYDLKVDILAQANNLDRSYLITPGQTLSLIVGNLKSIQSPIKQYRVSKGDTLFSIASEYGVEVQALALANRLDSPFLLQPGQIITLDTNALKTAQGKPVQTSKKLTSVNQTKAETPTYSKNLEWKWPVKGEVIESFSPAKLQKGIKVKSVAGSTVHAAALGNVVYAGSGLRGYGKLIIIKHSDMLLSAYANNEKLLVKVGQSVQHKDEISKLGLEGMMYFEIRKDGDPVNPLNYIK